MFQNNDSKVFYGTITLVSISVIAMILQLCWMNHGPQFIFQKVKSLFQNRRRHGRRSDEEENNLANSQSHEEDVMIQEAAEIELEMFLAGFRSALQRDPSSSPPAPILLNSERQEFISNVLIAKLVVSTETEETEDVFALEDQGGFQKDNIEVSCAICLINYKSGDTICFSHNEKCSHHFHRDCIVRWLLQDRDDCPCCRNNYLSLGEDSDVEPETYTEESHSTAPSTEPSIEQNLDQNSWIPSYDAPLHSAIGSRHQMHHDLPREQSATNLNNSVTLTIQSEQSNREDNASLADPADEQDEWSCPSLQAMEEGVIDPAPRNMKRKRTRRQAHFKYLSRRSSDVREIEEHQSLQLGDLIIEGLLERLQNQSDDQSTGTTSSTSLYTTTEPSSQCHDLRQSPASLDRLELCAICEQKYEVSEQLCWSQDPLCTHVFHRRCMEEWITEGNNFCPFCISNVEDKSVYDEGSTSSSISDSRHLVARASDGDENDKNSNCHDNDKENTC